MCCDHVSFVCTPSCLCLCMWSFSAGFSHMHDMVLKIQTGNKLKAGSSGRHARIHSTNTNRKTQRQRNGWQLLLRMALLERMGMTKQSDSWRRVLVGGPLSFREKRALAVCLITQNSCSKLGSPSIRQEYHSFFVYHLY